MNRKGISNMLPLLILSVSLLVSLLLIVSKPAVQKQAGTQYKPVVNIITVEKQPYQFTVASQGTIAPNKTFNISSTLEGKVVWVSPSYKKGQQVKAGEPLLKLDATATSIALESAKAALANAEILMKDEQQEHRRSKKLSQTRKQQRLQQAKARLNAAKLAVIKANQDFEATNINARSSGIIDKIFANEGEYIAAGQSLYRLLSTTAAEIRLPVSSQDIAFLDLDPQLLKQPNQLVKLSSSNGQTTHYWQASIRRIEQQLDPNTHCFTIVANVDQPYNPAHHATPLWYGQYVSAHIAGRSSMNVAVIPSQAIYPGDYVYTVSEEILHRKKIHVLRREDNFAIVDTGLENGDHVLTSRLNISVEGMEVAPRYQHNKLALY